MSRRAGAEPPRGGDRHTRRHRSGSRWRTLVLRPLAGVLLLWFVVASALSVLGAQAAMSGADRVRELELSMGPRELTDGQVDRSLDAALDDMRRADDLLGHGLLGPVRILPIAGRQLRTATALTATATDVLSAADRALAAFRGQLTGAPPAAPDRVAVLARLITELRAIEAVLATAELGPSDALVEPLRRARWEMDRKLDEAERSVTDLLAVLEGLHQLLEGPSRHVVLAANNAEMRIGAGMPLSIGSIEIENGRLLVDREFAPAGDVVLPQSSPLPQSMESLWGWSGMGRDWRDLGFSARFPANAAVAARMWESLVPGDVDGVLMLDVEGLRGLLEVVGPVLVDDRMIDAGNVVDHLLRDQYVDADEDLGNAHRRERLKELAESVLEALGRPGIDLLDLVDQLHQASRGRHLLAWSTHPGVQSTFEILNVDGELDSRSLLVGLANVDGSKLDPYMEVSVTATTSAHRGGVEVDLVISIANAAPDELPRYVVGTDNSPAYRGLVSAHVPALAQSVALTGFDGLAASGRDGPTVVVAAPVTVQQGEMRTGRLRFVLPDARIEALRIESGARVPAARWTIDGRPHDDDSVSELPLSGS